MSDDSFRRTVLDLVQQIPRGRVATYGQLASLAGSPRAARAVGGILSSLRDLPEADRPPWHRVINSRGQISAQVGSHRFHVQRGLLESEGVEFDSAGRCELRRVQWRPSPE